VDDNDAAAFADERRLLRFDYANDYFTGTDRYFTQGLGLQYFDPVLRRSPVHAPAAGAVRGGVYGLNLRTRASRRRG